MPDHHQQKNTDFITFSPFSPVVASTTENMAATKRPLDDVSSGRKHKKTKTSEKPRTKEANVQKPSTLVTEEVDFPRGGGTSFTPLEVKAIRSEAAKEADEVLFKVRYPSYTRFVKSLNISPRKHRKRKARRSTNQKSLTGRRT